MESGINRLPHAAAIQGELWGARAKDWAEVQEGMVRPLYEAVVSKTGIGPRTKLLDVGCGSGMFCAMAAQRASEISGIDASPALIRIAKSRAPGGNFRVSDMETLPYADGSFHVVTGFNAFQYAANPIRALGEARRVAQREATVVVAVWGKAEDCQAAAYLLAVGSLLPPPPPGTPGPFALSEGGALQALAAEAGLLALESGEVDCPWVYPDQDTVLRGLLSAGPAVKAVQTSGEDRLREAVLKALAPFKTPSGGYRLESKFRYLIARA